MEYDFWNLCSWIVVGFYRISLDNDPYHCIGSNETRLFISSVQSNVSGRMQYLDRVKHG